MSDAPQTATPPAERGPARGLRRLLDAAQRRFRRARPGSVLILVVALLVLLALIGTAFISTAGTDRDSAVQNQYVTQVEMLLESIKELSVLQIVGKVGASDSPVNRE